MILTDILHMIERRFLFWKYRYTPEFKDYAKKIAEIENNMRRLRNERDAIRFQPPCLPKVKVAVDCNGTVKKFTRCPQDDSSNSMVKIRRVLQGGGLETKCELGDRFDALCNRLEMQLDVGERIAARTTYKAIKEINAELRNKSKSIYLAKLQEKLN